MLLKKLSIPILDKKNISDYGAIAMLVLGLALFLYIGGRTMMSSATEMTSILLPTPATEANQPSVVAEKDLAELYGGEAKPAEMGDTRERFRINGSTANDSLLLAAPLAQRQDRVVGILTSSNPLKNIAIIDSTGKQMSYGVNDRINGMAAIIKIFEDRVVINENGFYAALVLSEQ